MPAGDRHSLTLDARLAKSSLPLLRVVARVRIRVRMWGAFLYGRRYAISYSIRAVQAG